VLLTRRSYSIYTNKLGLATIIAGSDFRISTWEKGMISETAFIPATKLITAAPKDYSIGDSKVYSVTKSNSL
jgi:hypothetical protein